MFEITGHLAEAVVQLQVRILEPDEPNMKSVMVGES